MSDKKEQNGYSGLNRFIRSQAVQTILNRLDDGTFSEFFGDWKWIFSFSKSYRGSILLYTLMGVGGATLGLYASVVSKDLIDAITEHRTGQLVVLIIAMALSTVLSITLSSLASRFSTKLSVYVNNDIQSQVFGSIMDADWMALTGYSNGDLLNRFNSDVSTVAGNAVSWLPNTVIAVYSFFATFAVILHYDVTMAFIALLSAPFMLAASRFLIRKNREYRKEVVETNSRLMSFEAESFYNIDTIKSFGISEHYSRGLKGWQERFKKVTLNYNLFTIKTNIFTELLGAMVSMVAFCYCLFRLWSGHITFGTMTLFLSQRSKLSSNFSSLMSIVPGMLNSSVSAHRIRELMDLPGETHLPEESAAMAAAADKGFEVRMSGISFSYVEEKQVITDSSFSAKPGEIIALVGPSGEGKTTMIRMILGLIHPDKGRVELVTADGSAVTINADTRRYFAYVPQGNSMLSGTVAENLRMVKEDATDEEIITALKTACAWDFVSRLPEGINGVLGERGKGISEGQAQRISIARAILRDSPILLLDEATSALDVETERKVLRNIIRSHPTKTCIVTTHRPSVLSMCRRVYRVMDTRVTWLDEAASSKMVQDF